MGKVRRHYSQAILLLLFFGLSKLYLPPPDSARRPGIAQLQYRLHVHYMVLLPVTRWRVGSTVQYSR